MAITMRDFAPAMGFLCEMLPMQRALSDEALAMAWETMPNAAKIHLSPESLAFAVKQRLVDPAPPKEQALHIQLLRYAFPLERTVKRERGEEVNSDRVILDQGLRSDLAERMAAPDRFHDPAPVRQEQAAAATQAPRLPMGGRPWHPSEMTGQQRAAHLQRIEAALQRVLAGHDDRPWSKQQLAQGCWWYGRALQGFWPLEADDGGLAAAWVRSNPEHARKLLADARANAGAGLPGAAEVVSGFAGGWR